MDTSENSNGPNQRQLLDEQSSSLFTGREAEIEYLGSLLKGDEQDQTSVLVVYGLGGIGKSALLGQFMKIAEQSIIPAALVDASVCKGVFEILTSLHKQLSTSLSFPAFEEGLKRRQEIKDKLLGRRHTQERAADICQRRTYGPQNGTWREPGSGGHYPRTHRSSYQLNLQWGR